MKILIILFLVFISLKHSAQNYIPFRNVLNEGTYWFYEQNYDSACYYYKKAEYFNLKFFRMESHLYSRALWEIGDKKKSIKILLKGGARFSFINDTTFYNGMSKTERLKINESLPKDDSWTILKDSIFYDTLHTRDQKYRQKLKTIDFDSTHSDFKMLFKYMNYNDSLNQVEIIKYIKKNGYPGGYFQAHPVFSTILLHSSKEWLFKNYNLFISEIRAGRMDPLAFSMAFDRFNVSSNCKTGMIYNSYFGVDSSQSLSPELVFINSCNIGLDPYFDNMNHLIFKRGFKPRPLKTPLYEYYKKQKIHFNCSKFQ